MKHKISTESPYLIPVLEKDIKDFIKEIPKSPGVYKFLDKSYFIEGTYYNEQEEYLVLLL